MYEWKFFKGYFTVHFLWTFSHGQNDKNSSDNKKDSEKSNKIRDFQAQAEI